MSSDNRKGYKAFGAGMICAPDKQHIKQYAEHTTYEEQGGEILKPDTWYKLEGGEFVEAAA